MEDNAVVYFIGNTAHVAGGAIYLHESNIELHNNAEMYLIENTSGTNGGAITMEDCSPFMTNLAAVHFINNISKYCGAIFILNSSLKFLEHSKVNFTNNKAYSCGGAIYQATDDDVTVSKSTFNLIFNNNSAFQRGAFYFTTPASLVVENDSFILFTDNFASHVHTGGAIFAQVPYFLPMFPCS